MSRSGIATLLALALFATCPADAQTTEPTLELDDCRINAGPVYPGIKARCGTLERPLDPSDPDGETIDLFVAVVAALTLEPAPDPIVPIAGGPGQATTTFYASTSTAFEDLRRERDILLIDQRGTGKSAAMNCDVDEDVVQGRVTTEQTLEATRRCLDSLPHDPRFFTTSVAVRDLEAVRQALGYGPLNLYGISYGTRVAQHFARRYPASTRTVVLDGVVPPQLTLGPAIAIEAQRAIDDIIARCLEDVACSTAFPTLRTDFSTLRKDLESGPVDVERPHPVTGETTTIEFDANAFSGVIRLLAYQPMSIALIPFLVDQAAKGNLAPMAAQFISVRDSVAEAMSGGMHNAVICTEDAPFIDGEAVSDEELALTYIGPAMLHSIETMCSIWPAGVMDEDLKTPLATDIPVLMLSGEVDPITPPAYAEMAALDLENVLLLTGRLQGHGLAPQGCTPHVMAEFVAKAAVTGIDTGCFERHFAMPFFIDFTGPSP